MLQLQSYHTLTLSPGKSENISIQDVDMVASLWSPGHGNNISSYSNTHNDTAGAGAAAVVTKLRC